MLIKNCEYTKTLKYLTEYFSLMNYFLTLFVRVLKKKELVKFQLQRKQNEQNVVFESLFECYGRQMDVETLCKKHLIQNCNIMFDLIDKMREMEGKHLSFITIF